MEKIFDLLEVAIATLLVVAAVSVQLYDNRQLTAEFPVKHIGNSVEEVSLRYSCNGLELAAHLNLLAEKEELRIVYAETEYSYVDFCRNILGISLTGGERVLVIDPNVGRKPEQQRFYIYQQDGKWRIEQ